MDISEIELEEQVKYNGMLMIFIGCLIEKCNNV